MTKQKKKGDTVQQVSNQPLDLRGLGSVRVKRETVLERLRANRDAHRSLFEEAIEGWHKEVLRVLDEQMKRAKANKRHVPQVYLPQPQDHTAEYDQAIEMLEMSLDDELELTAREFAQYVRDDWQWRNDFITSSASYASAASVENYANRSSTK